MGTASALEKAFFGHLVVGTASGAVTGGTEGAGWGAFSALTSFGIARAWPGSAGPGKGVFGSGLTSRELSARVVAHSMAGGITSVLQGGKFGHGFASAGFTAGLSPALANMNTVSATIASALIGGTISAATGGKFANGAVTSAMYIALRGAASPVTGYRDGDHLQDFDDLGDPPGAPARAFYSASDGRITRMGWENPSDHEQGFGFRIRVSAPDGTEYVYAHVDPESVVNTVGQMSIRDNSWDRMRTRPMEPQLARTCILNGVMQTVQYSIPLVCSELSCRTIELPVPWICDAFTLSFRP